MGIDADFDLKKDETSALKIIIPLSILTGLSCSIPIPFLDDITGNILRTRIVSGIMSSGGYEPTGKVVQALSGSNEPGCAVSCLTMIVVAPIKFILKLLVKVFSKIFFYLEIKRGIDVTSRVLVYSLLLDWIIQGRLWTPERAVSAEKLSAIIHGSCSEVGTKPIEGIISAAFGQGKKAISHITKHLRRRILRVIRRPKKEEMERALEELEPEQELNLVAGEIYEEMMHLHDTYFKKLKETFLDRYEKELTAREEKRLGNPAD